MNEAVHAFPAILIDGDSTKRIDLEAELFVASLAIRNMLQVFTEW